MIRRSLLLTGIAWLALAARADDLPTGLLADPGFTQYTAYSDSAQLMRRLVTPLNAWRLKRRAAATGVAIAEQPVDLTHEHFALYVPAHAPADGYALLVFVPPWDEAKVPSSWTPVLDRHGMIFVTAANIGNDTNLLDRRDPVALLAAANVMARYRVNPQRIYVAGFSGGSRVAQRLALGYPDLFRGALLEAGSDRMGDTVPLPPTDLLQTFQAQSRIVYLTGARDGGNQDMDRASRQSLHEWCMDNVDLRTMPWTGHDLAEASAFDRALTSLEIRQTPDAAKLAACRARIAAELDAALDKVQAAWNANRVDDASKQLEAIDHRYGGLAAPRSVEWASQLQQSTPPAH
jgi:pimeloyl-ACP methyl ester carboxylesterase